MDEEKKAQPIGINELNAIARKYILPPLVDNLYRLPPGWEPPKYTRRQKARFWRQKRYRRVGRAWRALKGEDE